MGQSTIAGLKVLRVAEQEPTFNLLVYGESGVGKTTLAGSSDGVPEMRKVLLVDVEGGTLSLRNSYPDVETVRVKTWTEMQSVYDQLHTNPSNYTTVIIDSLTEVQKMSMDAVMRKLVAEYEERDADVPGIREWNINIEQTRKFVRAFRDLPINTIFTALSRSDKNPMKGSVRRKPSLSGKVADEVAAFLDIVVYMYAKEIDGVNKRMILCASTEDTVAKDRTGKLPVIVEDPTMNEIWKCVRG